MKKNRWLITGLLLIVCNITFCQNKIEREAISDSMFFTTDELYWNGDKYLIHRSFLTPFKGYKSIYPSVSMVEIMRDVGTAGNPFNQNYYPVWMLEDSVLSLREIEFYSTADFEERFPNAGQYTIMEKLTGQKFQKGNNKLMPDSIPKESVVGSMPARWVNGVFYIKKVRRSMELDFDQWEQLPYRILRFKNGKLISVGTTQEDKPAGKQK